jgi:hypothetical protein
MGLPPTLRGSGKGTSDSLAHKFDRGSKGKVTTKEFGFFRKRIIGEMGHYDGERIIEGLSSSLDSDGHIGGRSISKSEGEEALKNMQHSRYSGLSSKDIEKAREILSEYE